MASVYIIYSKLGDVYYVGSCLDLMSRIAEHNAGKYENSYTSKYSDWELYLSIDELEYSTAREIEKHIKKMKSRKYIENLNRYLEMRDKLVKRYS